MSIGEGLQVESEQFAAMVPTGDLDEGINAWIERRPPVYPAADATRRSDYARGKFQRIMRRL